MPPRVTHKAAFRRACCHSQRAQTAAKEVPSLEKQRCFLPSQNKASAALTEKFVTSTIVQERRTK